MEPFWINKTLDQFSSWQWEMLCDGCGRCCLQKLHDPKTGKIIYTSVACYLLDLETCCCTDYACRHVLVPDCLKLNPKSVPKMRWLPSTCAYRLIYEGKQLPPWHPLVSGSASSAHEAGISIRHKAISETCVHPDDLTYYIIEHQL
ncbi:MAG: YcgN family cysteine cluster protein [Desulfobacteraceae bacterium]|nr:YcgN family cysteine cluster protein [Desulfobacteraceae bacterium]